MLLICFHQMHGSLDASAIKTNYQLTCNETVQEKKLT